MKKIILSSFLVAATIGLVFTGCKKDTTSSDTDTEFAANNAQGESASNDVVNYADAAANSPSGSATLRVSSEADILGGCAIITHDSTGSGLTMTRTITIDFGTGCTNANGKVRKGKIIITHQGHYFDNGSVKIITFDGFYINDRHIEGRKSITNNGKNSAGHSNWTISADFTITSADGKVFTWKSSRNREMIAGEGTITMFDDAYSITGSASGSNKRGIDYTATIVKPLVRILACDFIESGSIDFVVGTKPTRTFDYGDGTCDDLATVTIDGHSYPVTLR
jgi:hypothetical protein